MTQIIYVPIHPHLSITHPTTAARLSCFIMDVTVALVFKKEPVYHVWMREMSPMYIACNMEQHLMDHLPGYEPQTEPNEHHDATPMSGAAYGAKDVCKEEFSQHDAGSDDSGIAKATLKA
jgi:hypothetical protein